MDGKHLKIWRKSLGLSQKHAAESLGLKLRIYQYYEKGERDGVPIKPPKTVRLACWAVAQGLKDFTSDDVMDTKHKIAALKSETQNPSVDG